MSFLIARRSAFGFDLERHPEYDQGDTTAVRPRILGQRLLGKPLRKRHRHDGVEKGGGNAQGDQGVMFAVRCFSAAHIPV